MTGVDRLRGAKRSLRGKVSGGASGAPQKGIDDFQAPDDLSMLEVLGVEPMASKPDRRGDDEAVIP